MDMIPRYTTRAVKKDVVK